MIEVNKGYNCDNIDLLRQMPDGVLDFICIDPPYLYLKGQKLERVFDEQLFFSECKRVLKKDGFIVLFGRGVSFYRWNTILDDLGLNFKEEIIWDKSFTSSPLMNISRVHETISIFSKGKGVINRVKVPYVEMKEHDINAMTTDINRIKASLNNTDSLNAILNFIATGNCGASGFKKVSTSISSEVKSSDRAAITLKSIVNGLNEKTIIRNGRDHYNTIHPTQKPVRLLERLIALVKPKQRQVIAADFFAGSFSFAEACINMGINWICCEIDKEYYDLGTERIEQIKSKQLNQPQELFA